MCAVHLVRVPSSWARNTNVGKAGRGEAGGKSPFPSLNSCARATNDHKSAAFTVFLWPDVELQAERDKGTAG